MIARMGFYYKKMQPFVIKGCIQIGWVCCKRTENRVFWHLLKQKGCHMVEIAEKFFLPWG